MQEINLAGRVGRRIFTIEHSADAQLRLHVFVGRKPAIAGICLGNLQLPTSCHRRYCAPEH